MISHYYRTQTQTRLLRSKVLQELIFYRRLLFTVASLPADKLHPASSIYDIAGMLYIFRRRNSPGISAHDQQTFASKYTSVLDGSRTTSSDK